jgi:diguanylate cyclase (GGDEF)-like protein/PAS domain S-box-containing protein
VALIEATVRRSRPARGLDLPRRNRAHPRTADVAWLLMPSRIATAAGPAPIESAIRQRRPAALDPSPPVSPSSLDHPAIAQAAMSAMIADLVPGDSPETTAEAICDRVLTLPGIAYAALGLFLPDDRLESLAAVAIDGVPITPVDRGLPWTRRDAARARKLLELAQSGPSIERWVPKTSTPMATTFARLGITALALAPVTSAGRTIGFLQLGATGADGEGRLRATLPALASFGAVASVLIGQRLDARAVIEERRAMTRRVIDLHAFRPVFQPIVTLASGMTVGFEALTRFADGVAPDTHFAAAAEVGLGIELELATLEAALAASTALPRDAWLDVNVSAALLDDPARLAYLLWKAGSRSIVLEITEHEAIEDYAALRRRIDEIGIPLRLAVDDAGAGYASLRHILELRPDIVKLDRSLVVDIDSDPVRQGLVAGLRHFASIARARVVAEGIETQAEYAVLVDLGIELGQGYLLGRPGSVRKVGSAAAQEVERRASYVKLDAAWADSPDLVHRVNAILWEADGTDDRMTFVSEGATSVTGHAPDRWLTERRFWENHIHPDDRPAMLDAIGDAMHSAQSVSLEYRFRLADGTYRWFEDLVEILPGEGGHTRLVGVMIDVTDRRRMEEQLAHRATHDSLTGLLNREGFHQLLARAVPLPGVLSTAVIFLDLDDFKMVNDSLGHRAGDELLQLIAGRLRAVVRNTDAVARYGGDEFLILATAADEAALVDLGRRLVEAVAEPSDIGGRSMAHPVSGGIAFIRPGEPSDQTIRNADLAMYEAKRAGGGHLRVFDSAMLQAAVDRLDRSPAA